MPARACGHKKNSAKIQNFPMDTGKHGEGTPQSTSPANDRKKSRKPIADPDSQLRMNDATKADAWGRWWFRVGTINDVASMMKRSGEVMLCQKKVGVWFAGGEI